MEVVATARWVRTTARKARLVAATVQGLTVEDALTVLRFTPRAAAREVAKVIKSAAANAEHNYNLDAADLRVARIEVDGASIIKRFRPRAQGRAFSIFKRTAHIRAVVTDEVAATTRRGSPAPSRGTAAPPVEPAAAAPRRARRAAAASAAEEAAPRARSRRRQSVPAAPSPAELEGRSLQQATDAAPTRVEPDDAGVTSEAEA